MKPRTIEGFFRALDRRAGGSVVATLVGGAAAVLYGISRATQDIDFEVKALGLRTRGWSARALEQALRQTRAETGVEIQFTEDWDRTSSVAMPGRRPKPVLYRRIGKVRLNLMHPLPWSIGKLARGTERDIEDVVAVFRLKKSALGLSAPRVARYWGRALGSSPLSSALDLFRAHVEQFFSFRGVEIWGPSFRASPILDLFMAAARGASKRRS